MTTEQDVKEKEANSTNLNLFIATVGDEVVGYCGLSEYREDQGALYIPLLNVHPAYQGLKIGKQLVLKAVERTVELKWPRLDLFTWPGNTKAVPLYKKCGFFWEDRDNVTHLMNFMPLVLQNDMLRPFFEKNDWYLTSQQIIDIKPDGIKENDHTYYEYKWEAGDDFVTIQIERTGRGIRLIETNDLLIEMSVPDFKLLEKEKHTATYRIVNKTITPLSVSISGQSSETVSHHFKCAFKVIDEWIGEYPATVTVPQNEPSPWKTHPILGADLTINGQPLSLKMGVFPNKAGKLHFRSTKKNWRPNQEGTLFLDLESHLNEDATWTINLPVNDVVQWNQSEVTTTIKEKGCVSIPLSIKLLKNDFLTEEVDVLVERPNGQSFTFTSKIATAFPGYGAKFGGETDEYWYGYNGPYYVEIERRNHFVKIGSTRSKQEPHKFFSPKLGKPFSEEFSKKEASTIEYIECPEALIVKTSLPSEAFSPLILNTFFKIFGDGLIEITHQLFNNGKEDMGNISLLQSIYPEFKGMAVPQQDGVMIGAEASIPFMDYIRDKDISERWIFTSTINGETKGLAWSEQAIARKDDFRFGIEYTIEKIEAENEVLLGPLQVGVNATQTWSDWRELVIGEDTKPLKEKSIYEIEAAHGDCISSVGEKVDYSFRSLLTPYIHGNLTVSHADETYELSVDKNEELTKIDFQLEHLTTGVKCLQGIFRSASLHGETQSYQLVKGKREVMVSSGEYGWTVNNGVLSFKAASSYIPGIYSLAYLGKEVLDHQYPEVGPKAWWNPWGGGLRYTFQNVSLRSMLKEETTVQPITKLDQYGHQWTGLCISTAISNHEMMKDVVLHQFALTLPEVPILVVYSEIEQNSGRTFSKEVLHLEGFFKLGEKLSSCFANVSTDGVFHTYYAGIEEHELNDAPTVTIGSVEQNEKVTLIHPKNRKRSEVYTNQEVFVVASVQEWSASSKTNVKVSPTVLLFGDDEFRGFNQQFVFK